ncbi:hypothetical protein Syun_002294 [Stephania yunnanensis]|uniref:Uncharacterized protein n=1 Tax=Stephania yunnanensis TaxID=152371 RepID=A0AAP0Q8N1_9MAGN
MHARGNKKKRKKRGRKRIGGSEGSGSLVLFLSSRLSGRTLLPHSYLFYFSLFFMFFNYAKLKPLA